MVLHARKVALIGAGGKTSVLCRLAEELAGLGETVVATTTTKVFPLPFPSVWKDPWSPPPSGLGNPCFWYAGVEADSGKWVGPQRSVVEKAMAQSLAWHRHEKAATGHVLDVENSREPIWLIEADGAKGRKLKCWAIHEPQIPANVQCAVLLIDGTLWGRVPDQAEIHRGELCPELGERPFEAIALGRYLELSPIYDPAHARLAWIVLINLYGASARLQEHILAQARHIALPPEGRALHLRLAAGDVRCGRMRWLDLW